MLHSINQLSPLDDHSVAVFFSQLMISFLLMTTRKISGTGQVVLGENISIKRMLKLKDWQRRLQNGKERRVNKTKRRRRKATRSCMRSCRGNMMSTWLEQHVKRKRLDRERSAGTTRSVQLLSRVAPQRPAQS